MSQQNISPRYVKLVWTDDELTKIDQKSLLTLNLPEETLKILVNVGVPKEEILFLKFDGNIRPLLKEMIDSEFPTQLKDRFYVLGREGERNYLCVDAQDGTVVIIDKKTGKNYIVNSGLGKLLECLSEFKKIQKERDQISENYLPNDSNREIVSKFQKKILNIDPLLEKTEYYWPVIIEQMEHQFL